FFYSPPPTHVSTLSLHDALPISLSEPCCLVAFVVDFREAADLAAVGLGLVQGGGRHDGAGQAVAADRVVQVDFVDRGSFVSEGDGEAGVAHLADAAGSSGGCGEHGGGL